FSAAVASLAIASGKYLGPITKEFLGDAAPGFVPQLIGVTIILLVVFVQLRGVRAGGIFQNIMTNMKLALIAVMILAPLLLLPSESASGVSFLPSATSKDTILSMPFAGSLVWVLFAYSGWNASAYIAGNMRDPKKNLPYSLLVGTGVVTLVYLSLTAIFMYTCKFSEMAGIIDVGNVVVSKVFTPRTSLFFGAFFAVALIAGINAMFIAGPRVTQKMGSDHRLLSSLEKETSNGAPVNAILLQAFISIGLVVFSDFKSIIEYVGLTLTIFSTMTVLGVFILRFKKMTNENTIRTFGYPITPLLFLVVSVWMIVYFVKEDPKKLLWSLLTVIPAIPIHYLSKKNSEVRS
ncbi:MAG: APC family permease, partial [Bacteroidota bacterium]